MSFKRKKGLRDILTQKVAFEGKGNEDVMHMVNWRRKKCNLALFLQCIRTQESDIGEHEDEKENV